MQQMVVLYVKLYEHEDKLHESPETEQNSEQNLQEHQDG